MSALNESGRPLGEEDDHNENPGSTPARAGDDSISADPTDLVFPIHMEPFNQIGNGNRFYQRHGNEVLMYKDGNRITFFDVDEAGRWIENFGANSGRVERRAFDVIAKLTAWLKAKEKQTDDLGEEFEVKGSKDYKELKEAENLKGQRQFVKQCQNIRSAREMAETACVMFNMTTSPDAFDINDMLLATPTQMLEAADGKVIVRKIRPADMVTFSTAVDYDPEILNNEPYDVTLFRETFMADDTEFRVLLKLLGSALFGSNYNRLIVILLGRLGTNGKTQFMEALRATLKDYVASGGVSVFRGNFDDKPRPDLICLLKKRYALFSEASDSWEIHADHAKKLVGNDALSVRKMRSDDMINMVPQFMPVIYTNNVPGIAGSDKATRRRILGKEFNRQPKNLEDPEIGRRFINSKDVQRWILAALVRGYEESVCDGMQDVFEALKSFSDEVFAETSHVGEFFQFLDDSNRLERMGIEEMSAYGAKTKFVSKKVLHAVYVCWIDTHGDKQQKNEKLKLHAFNKHLTETYGWIEVKTNKGMAWEGKCLRSEPGENGEQVLM